MWSILNSQHEFGGDVINTCKEKPKRVRTESNRIFKMLNESHGSFEDF